MNDVTSYAVITAVGTDRVGIVDDLTATLLEHSCNIEESRMAVLGGEFAVILLVSGREKDLERLAAQAERIGSGLGLRLDTKPTKAPVAPAGLPYLIESVSFDTVGIVHAITAVLRRHGLNIEDLETETSAAPWTGAPMFIMRVRITVPAGFHLAALRAEIDQVAAQLDLDVRIGPVPPGLKEK